MPNNSNNNICFDDNNLQPSSSANVQPPIIVSPENNPDTTTTTTQAGSSSSSNGVEEPANTATPLYFPLNTTHTISTNKKLLSIKVTNYPNNQPSNEIFYDYTIISPIIDLTVTRKLNTDDKLFYTLLVKLYKSNVLIAANVVYTQKICYYVKPITPFTDYPERTFLSYYMSHVYNPIFNNNFTIQGMTVEVIDTDSEFDVSIINVNSTFKFTAVLKS